MNYKVGMKVKIVNEFDYDDPVGFNYEMERLKGKVATITSLGRGDYGEYYRIDIDHEENYWTDGMLLPLALNKGKPEEKIVDEYIKNISLRSRSGLMQPMIIPSSRFTQEYISSFTPTDYQTQLIRRILSEQE